MNQRKPRLFNKIDERVMEGYLERKCLMDDPAPGQRILDFSGTTFSNLGGIQMKFPEFAHLRKVAYTIIRYIEIMQPEFGQSGES